MSISTPSLYAALSSTGGNVSKTPGVCAGIMVTSASSTPTITVYDDPATGTGTPILAVFTPVVGFLPLRFKYSKGLNVVLSGTVTCTVFYDNSVGA